jgi:preprotein translocase subunit SecG
MDDRAKTLTATAIVLGIVFVVIMVIFSIVFHRKTMSPVPDESGIKIIFITPTMIPSLPTATPSPTPKAAKK